METELLKPQSIYSVLQERETGEWVISQLFLSLTLVISHASYLVIAAIEPA